VLDEVIIIYYYNVIYYYIIYYISFLYNDHVTSITLRALKVRGEVDMQLQAFEMALGRGGGKGKA
jgi:hypothetical protein